MSNGQGQRVRFEDLRTVAFGSVTSGYTAVGTPTEHPVRLICFTNTTDKVILFSLDGVNDMIVVPNGSFKLLDLTANKTSNDSILAISANTTIYAKYAAAPGSGAIYVEVLYGE